MASITNHTAAIVHLQRRVEMLEDEVEELKIERSVEDIADELIELARKAGDDMRRKRMGDEYTPADTSPKVRKLLREKLIENLKEALTDGE